MSTSESEISISNESNIAPTVDNSSQVELPPSGGLSGSGAGNFKKPTEDEIVASFNKPQTNQSSKPVATEPIKTAIAPVVDETPVEETDEQKAEQLAKDESEAEQAESITPEEDISVAKIMEYARNSPELKTAFDKNPGMRNSFMAMARRSSKLSEYQSIIPSPEAAKFAAQNSEQMVQLNDSFFSENPEDHTNFWQSLHTNSLMKDPVTGEIVIDKATGQPVSTGAYERVTGAYRQALWQDLSHIAGNIKDPEQAQKVKDAIELIGSVTGDLKKPLTQNQPDLPDEIKRRLEHAEKLERQLKDQSQAQQQDFTKTTTSEIVSTIKNDVSLHLERMVKTQNIALTAYEQKNVVSDIFTELDKLASENKQYQLHFDSLSKKSPLTLEGRKALVNEARKFAKDNLPSIALKVIREATQSTVEKSTQKEAKRVEQASRKEVKTSGNAPSIGNSSQDLKTKAAELIKANNGKKLTEAQILGL